MVSESLRIFCILYGIKILLNLSLITLLLVSALDFFIAQQSCFSSLLLFFVSNNYCYYSFATAAYLLSSSSFWKCSKIYESSSESSIMFSSLNLSYFFHIDFKKLLISFLPYWFLLNLAYY